MCVCVYITNAHLFFVEIIVFGWNNLAAYKAIFGLSFGSYGSSLPIHFQPVIKKLFMMVSSKDVTKIHREISSSCFHENTEEGDANNLQNALIKRTEP